MSAPTVSSAETGGRWVRRARTAAPPAVAVVLLLGLDAALGWLVGTPARFPSTEAYRRVLDALSLLRYAVIFGSALVVWPLMRLRGASVRAAVLGIGAVPVAFAVVSGWHGLAYFPPGEALYYGLNPLVVGSVCAAATSAGLAEILVRLRLRRRGQPAGRALSWGPLVALGLGGAALFGTLLWNGGVYWFYVYMQGYVLLFGSGG